MKNKLTIDILCKYAGSKAFLESIDTGMGKTSRTRTNQLRNYKNLNNLCELVNEGKYLLFLRLLNNITESEFREIIKPIHEDIINFEVDNMRIAFEYKSYYDHELRKIIYRKMYIYFDEIELHSSLMVEKLRLAGFDCNKLIINDIARGFKL